MPRTSCCQVSSAWMRALTALGDMPPRVEHLGELLRRACAAAAPCVEGVVDLGVGDLERLALGLGDLEPVVDQFVEHLLARRLLVGGRRRSACVRCEISSSVIGSPLATTTTCARGQKRHARATAAHQAWRRRASAVAECRSIKRIIVSCPSPHSFSTVPRSRPVQILTCCPAADVLAKLDRRQRPQAHLQHDRVVEHRSPLVTIVGNVIQRPR